MNIIDELTWRGAVNQVTEPEELHKLTDERRSPSIVASIPQEIVCI